MFFDVGAKLVQVLSSRHPGFSSLFVLYIVQLYNLCNTLDILQYYGLADYYYNS